MTMRTRSRSRTFAAAADMMPWLLGLTIRLLARILNMPEPLVRTTGVFVFARVQTIESSVGKMICPVNLLRQFQSWLGRDH
jgi:hypothetical protein